MSDSEIYKPLYAFSHTKHPDGTTQYDLYVDGIEIHNYWISKLPDTETWQSCYARDNEIKKSFFDFLSAAQLDLIESYRFNNKCDLDYSKNWVTEQFLKSGFYLSEMKFWNARNGPPIAKLIHDGEVRNDFYLINLNHKNHFQPGMYEAQVVWKEDGLIFSSTVFSIEDGLKVLIDEFEAKK